MVNMVMTDDDPFNRPAGKRAIQQGIPMRNSGRVMNAAVQDDPAILTIQHIEIDMVEPKGQIEPEPVEVISQLPHGSFFGGRDFRRKHGQIPVRAIKKIQA